MIKEKIKLTDWEGNPREETWCFHLTDSDIVDWELSESGGLSKLIEKISETQDVPKLKDLYREVILKSVGKIDTDGRRFRRTDEIREEFLETGAFDVIFMKLLTEEGAGAAFINGLVSDKLRDAMKDNPQITAQHPAFKH